jgi:hypothetical protein
MITINVDGKIAEPVTRLIEKISEAIGGIAKSSHIKRIAKAQATAAIISADTKVKISQMSKVEKRAQVRLIHEEGKRQRNIENIITGAIPLLSAEARPENIENDLLSYFFDRCRLVSDEDMQALWSKILAGEANKPGSFSRRTIHFAATLEKTGADLITEAANFSITDRYNGKIIYRIPQYLANAGLTFAKLLDLEDMGILNGVQSGALSYMYAYETHGSDNIVPLNYNGKKTILIHKYEVENTLVLPAYLISRIGTELFRLGEFAVDDGYVIACARDIKQHHQQHRVLFGDMSVTNDKWIFSNLVGV